MKHSWFFHISGLTKASLTLDSHYDTIASLINEEAHIQEWKENRSSAENQRSRRRVWETHRKVLWLSVKDDDISQIKWRHWRQSSNRKNEEENSIL